jgi:hypothetical protein
VVRLDTLSDTALGILSRLLADDLVTNWILQNVVEEREARATGRHTFPLEIPVLTPEDARILNRHLILGAHILEDLVYQPHADAGPDEPFLEGACFLCGVSEALGKHLVAGAGKLQ